MIPGPVLLAVSFLTIATHVHLHTAGGPWRSVPSLPQRATYRDVWGVIIADYALSDGAHLQVRVDWCEPHDDCGRYKASVWDSAKGLDERASYLAEDCCGWMGCGSRPIPRGKRHWGEKAVHDGPSSDREASAVSTCPHGEMIRGTVRRFTTRRGGTVHVEAILVSRDKEHYGADRVAADAFIRAIEWRE